MRWPGIAAAVTIAALAAPAVAEATLVGLSAKTMSPSECFAPQRSAYASTSCQLFDGARLEIVALASRDDGSVRLMPQPFTLLALRSRGGPAAVTSFTLFDDNDADDTQFVTPPRSTDYQLRFEGNADIPPATSATMAVSVGAQLTIPHVSRSGPWSRVRVPAQVEVPRRALRGRIELRRCHRSKAFSARSCARPRQYTVVATRRAARSRRAAFTVAAPPRSLRRYEVAFRPASSRFATTRQAFSVLRGFDGQTTYRPTSRRAPFGNR